MWSLIAFIASQHPWINLAYVAVMRTFFFSSSEGHSSVTTPEYTLFVSVAAPEYTPFVSVATPKYTAFVAAAPTESITCAIAMEIIVM
jgi:hypothetical protein